MEDAEKFLLPFPEKKLEAAEVMEFLNTLTEQETRAFGAWMRGVQFARQFGKEDD